MIRPTYYARCGGLIEPIDFCRLFPFSFGNFCKYVLRAGKKGPEVEDLHKALTYLEWAQADLWQYEQSLKRYAHLAKAFNNQWLNVVFKSTDYAANLEAAKVVIAAYIELKEANCGA